MKRIAQKRKRHRRGMLPTASGFKLWLSAAYRCMDKDAMVMDMLPRAAQAWDNLSTQQRNNWTRASNDANDAVQPGWSIKGVEGAQVVDYLGQSPRAYF